MHQRHTPTNRARLWLVLAVAGLVLLAVVAYATDLPFGPVVVTAGVLCAFVAAIVTGEIAWGKGLNHQLQRFLGQSNRAKVVYETFPGYRLVDLQSACQRLAKRAGRISHLEYTCQGMLNGLLRVTEAVPVEQSLQCSFATGPDQRTFLPRDQFWLLEEVADHPGQRLILRLRYSEQPYPNCDLELAAHDQRWIEELARELDADAYRHSLYRGQNLEMRCDLTQNFDGDTGYRTGDLQLLFKPLPKVRDEDIVLEEEIRGLLTRNVLEYHEHGNALAERGLPRRRALLFYGPPGTGKSYTCLYLQTKLKGVTTFHVAGSALTRMQEIGKLARALKPSLVVLEDVDLVFTQREQGSFTTVLGDFMDLLDTLPLDEEILFILTTNAIERVEQAIRDRPGRINQCVFFDQPAAALRRRYFQRFLEAYPLGELDWDRLVKRTEHASQAFLRELILRTVQLACAEGGYRAKEQPRLEQRHFEAAYRELADHGNKHGRAILGFGHGLND